MGDYNEGRRRKTEEDDGVKGKMGIGRRSVKKMWV